MKRILITVPIFVFLFLLSGCATTTPLMRAAEQGDVRAAKDLLDKGEDVNEKGDFSSTALRQAAEFGQLAVVKLLLDRGADVNAQDAGGDSVLMVASLKGHADVVKLLLDRGANVMTRNMNGWTALAYASKGDVAKLLVDKGADINIQNFHGATILSSAAMSDRGDVVKLLIDRGADWETALSRCEDTLQEWSKSGNKYLREKVGQPKRCIALLKKVKTEREEAKRRELETARTRALEEQKAKEMKAIIKEVMAETAGAPKQGAKSPAVKSDIDLPDIPIQGRIMGDNDLAVIIGIEGYQSLPKSDYSYDDAVLVRAYARALGFKERNIELLTEERATLSGIVKSVDIWLRNKAKPSSRILVYYSGHGAPDPATGEAYLVPYDGDPNYLEVTGYSLKRLYETLGKLPAAEVTIVLDACFSGTGGRSVLAKGARPLVMATNSIAVPKNLVVLSATQGSQISTSSPARGHGVFTYYFLKALKDGKKNIAEIYQSIKPQVEDEAKELNVQQSPSVTPDVERIRGGFSLRK